MTVCTVYGDLLLFTDVLMDLALLYAVSRLGNLKTPWYCLVLASLLGGIYSLASLLPAYGFLRLWYGKLIFSFFMVKVAFPRLRGRRYGVAFLYFYLIGFAMAGAVVCLSWFFRRQGWLSVGFSYTAMGLSAGLLLVLILSGWGQGYVKKHLRLYDTVETVTIRYQGKKATVTALFDTGNELCDPVSRRPVVIAEYDALRALLPPYFCATFENAVGVDGVFAALQPYDIGRRLRLIPYTSIGESNGMLLGFCPDGLIFPERKKKEVKDVLICLYRGSMHTRQHCRCIVNPAILDQL